MYSMLRTLPNPEFTFTYEELGNVRKSLNLPGVYVWYGDNEEILYTGKALNVRTRLQSHITHSHNEGLHRDIQAGKVSHISVFPCESELDAIVLERYLISSGLYKGKHNEEFSTFEFSYTGIDLSEIENDAIRSKLERLRAVQLQLEEQEKERIRKEKEEEERRTAEAIKLYEEKRERRKQERLARIEAQEKVFIDKLVDKLSFTEGNTQRIMERLPEVGDALSVYLEELSEVQGQIGNTNLSKQVYTRGGRVEEVLDPIIYHFKAKPNSYSRTFREQIEQYVSFKWYKGELTLTENIIYVAKKRGITPNELIDSKLSRGAV